MDNNRRFFLAFLLTALVLVAANYFFPSAPPRPAPTATAVPGAPATPSAVPTPGAPVAGAPAVDAPAEVAAVPAAPVAPAVPAVPVETVTVGGARATYRVSSLGGALVGARMESYRSLRPNVAAGSQVELARPGETLLAYRLVVPGDTLALAQVPFRVTRNGTTVRLDGVASGRVARNVPVSLTYAVQPDSFIVRVQGSAQGVTGPSFLLIDLPSTLAVTERDSLDHYTQLSFAWKPRNEGASGEAFGSLDPGDREFAEGPLSWAVTKSKYFLVGVLATAQQPFAEATFTGGPRTSKLATRAQGTVVLPLANGGFAFDGYVGPQEWKRLVAMGRDFENANPYGGWLQGLVQPFATIAMRFILWMHDNLKLSYGWVLVALGVLVRLVMWPLQQNMLRNQIKMQRIQPELQLVQEKYKSDPQRFQQEMMKVYASHGMTPFSPLTGCLPMLLPMPIFFALFFVFQNTIEFRGVPFLWLADISLKDPFYVAAGARGGDAVPHLVDRDARHAAQPADADDHVHDAGDVPDLLPERRRGLNLYYLSQNLVGCRSSGCSRASAPRRAGRPSSRARR
jgi:YidC/Oxa1 family membrane protein insertase